MLEKNDQVEEDESIAEVATDKVDSEILLHTKGILQKWHVISQNPAPFTLELYPLKKIEEVKFNTLAHSDKIFVFSFVKSLDKEHGISNEELKKLKGQVLVVVLQKKMFCAIWSNVLLSLHRRKNDY